ncbi:hypothetical protein Emed_000358 [Eimeria media]
MSRQVPLDTARQGEPAGNKESIMFQWQARRFLDASLESFLSPFVESFDRNHANTTAGVNESASSLNRDGSLRTGLRKAASDGVSDSTGGRLGRSQDGSASAEQNVEADDAYLAGRGEVLYTNLKLKRTLLSDRGFPFTVAHGTVGSLTVSIPPLFSQLPIVVSIDSVLVLLVPQQQEEWCADTAKTSSLQQRRRSLDDFTALLLLEKERNGAASEALGSSTLGDAGKYEKAKSGPGGMQAFIRNNVQQMLLSKLKIQLSNIHIRYEHQPKAGLIPTAAPFSWGLVAPYLLLDHASVTTAAAAAAEAAIATSRPETRPRNLPAILSSRRLRQPVRLPSEQDESKMRKEVDDTNPCDLQKGLLISIAIYWQSNERKFFHGKENTEARKALLSVCVVSHPTVLFELPHELFSSPVIAAATTAAADAAAAAAVFAGHGGDPSLTGTRAGLLLRPAPSAPSPLRTKLSVNDATGTTCRVEHVYPSDKRDRHRHSINSSQRPWLLPLLICEAKLTFSKLALAQEHPPDTAVEELLHVFECRLGVVLFSVDREMVTDALSIVRHAETWRTFKTLTIEMPAALKPLRQLFFRDDAASSDDVNVDLWPSSITATLFCIPKKWGKAALPLRRWYYAVRCISWMKRLSSHSEHFCPFEAPQLLLLRLHATYIDTCCRLFHTRNSANVKGIQERLRALEDGPLANLTIELLHLWRRQAAMDLTLPAGDLALLHQHLCLPVHSRCTANDSLGDFFAASNTGIRRNSSNSAFLDFATLGSLQIPAFVRSIPDALRSFMQKPGTRAPVGAYFEGLPTHSEFVQGRQHENAGTFLSRRQPTGHIGGQSSEGERAYPDRTISQEQVGANTRQSGECPHEEGSCTHPQARRRGGHQLCRWATDPLPDEWSVKGDPGTQNIKCSISVLALGVRLHHKLPQATPAASRERWFLTRSYQVHSDSSNSPEGLREETTEWRYCPERVRFSGSLPKRRSRTTSFRLGQGHSSHYGLDPQRLSHNRTNKVLGYSSSRPDILGIGSRSRSLLLVNSRGPRKGAALPYPEDSVDVALFGLEFQSVIIFGSTGESEGSSRSPSPSIHFSVHSRTKSAPKELKAFVSPGAEENVGHRRGQGKGGMPYNGALFSIQAGDASVSHCLKRFLDHPLPQRAVDPAFWKLQRSMRGRRQTLLGTSSRVMPGAPRFVGERKQEETSRSDAFEGPSRPSAHHRLGHSHRDIYTARQAGQRRSMDTESTDVANSLSPTRAFMECSCSSRSFSLALFSPVLMPSPTLIHMLVSLWGDQRLNVHAELHSCDLAHSRLGSMPLYSSKTLFEPQILCSLTLPPTIFPSPSLHICKAAAAEAFLTEKASLSPPDVSSQRKVPAQLSGASDTSRSGSTESQPGIFPNNNGLDGPADVIRMKTVSVLSMLGSYASKSIKIGAAHVRGGVVRHTGEFRGMCPCVPAAYRENLEYKLTRLRELHWMKRPSEGYKVSLKVSKLAIVVPVASACTTKRHAVELKRSSGQSKMWEASLEGLPQKSSRLATNSELVDNAAMRLLMSCRRCSICRKETCCCQADPLSLLFQPPDLASPCVWLSCGELQANRSPPSAVEPEKADIRLLGFHAVVAPRLRSCLSLLQLSCMRRSKEQSGREWASHQRTSGDLNYTGDVDANVSPGTKLELVEDTHPDSNWQTLSEQTAQGYMPAPLRGFSKLGKLRRSFGARDVTTYQSSPQIIASCPEVRGHLVHRPEHSLFARGDGVVSSGWYTFLGCEDKVIPSEGSGSCSWCPSPAGANPVILEALSESLTKGQKTASFCSRSRGQLRSMLWCEWRRPTSQLVRHQSVCPSTELEEAGERLGSAGCCLCAFRRCVRPLSLWIYRQPSDTQPLIVLWPALMRLTDRAHREGMSPMGGMTRSRLGCATLQLLCSKPAPGICGFAAASASSRNVSIAFTMRESSPRNYVWSFGIRDAAEVEVLLRTCGEHPNDCDCNCQRSPFALLYKSHRLSGGEDFNVIRRGLSWEGSGVGGEKPVVAASINETCSKHGPPQEYLARPQPLGATARMDNNSAAPDPASLPQEEEGVWEGANLEPARPGAGPEGFVRKLRSQLLGYSIKVGIERIVLALVSPIQAQDLEDPEYVSQRFGGLGISGPSRGAALHESDTSEDHTPLNGPEFSPRRIRKGHVVGCREVEDLANLRQLKRQFGSGGLVVTFAGASLSATPSLLFPQQDHLSFCLRSMVAENTHVQARSRRRVLVQALGRTIGPAISRDHELASAVERRRRYDELLLSQSFVFEQERSEPEQASDSQRTFFDSQAGLAWEVEFGGLQLKILQCYTDICLCSMHLEKFCCSLTSNGSVRLRLCRIGITGGGPGLPILLTESRFLGRSNLPSKKTQHPWSDAAPRSKNSASRPKTVGSRFSITTGSLQSWESSVVTPWLDCCFHPAAACSTAVEERLRKEGYSSEACSSLSLSVGDSSFIVRLPELVLFKHFLSDCRVAMAEFRVALSQRQKHQLSHTQHFWTQESTATQEHDRSLLSREDFASAKSMDSVTHPMGRNALLILQPLLLLHVRLLLPTLVFASVDSTSPPPVVVSCGELKVSTDLSARARLPPASFDLRNVAKDIQIRLGRTSRRREPKGAKEGDFQAPDSSSICAASALREGSPSGSCHSVDVERWNVPDVCAALSPACHFKIRYDKLQMFLISTTTESNRQRENLTTHQRVDSPMAFPDASKRLSRIRVQKPSQRRVLSSSEQCNMHKGEVEDFSAYWGTRHRLSSQESDAFGTKPIWTSISDRASLTADLWKPLLPKNPWQGQQTSPDLGTLSNTTQSPSNLLPCEGIPEAFPYGGAAGYARPAQYDNIHRGGQGKKVPTFASFNNCLDLRCSHVHLRITPQLVAAFHANSRINVYASPQLPLAPRSSYDTLSFHEPRSRSGKNTQTSSRAPEERAGTSGELAGVSSGARRSVVGRKLSSEGAAGSSVAKFTGFTRGSQSFEPQAAASAASSEPRSKASSLNHSSADLQGPGDEYSPHATPELKDSNSTVMCVGSAFITECISSVTGSASTVLCFRTQEGQNRHTVTCEEQGRTEGWDQPQTGTNASSKVETEVRYIPPEICFCRFPLVLFPSMSQCVMGQEAVERLKALAEKLETTYRSPGMAEPNNVSEPSQEWAGGLLSSAARQLGGSVATSASLLPTAACLLIGNPAVLLQPRLVSVFHFFLASPMYALAPLGSFQTDVMRSSVSQPPQPRSQFSSVTEAPRNESATVQPVSLIREASDGSGVRESNAGRGPTEHSYTQNSGEQRSTVPLGSSSLRRESDFSVSEHGNSPSRRPLALADISVEDDETEFATASSQGNGISASPFHSRVVGKQAETGVDKVHTFRRRSESPWLSRLSDVANKDDAGLPTDAHSRGGHVDTGRGTGAMRHSSASLSTSSAVQQLQVLASWIAREFRTRLIQEAETAAAARLISRSKRLVRKRRRQGVRAGVHREMAKSTAAAGPSHAAGGHETASGSKNHLKGREGTKSRPNDAAGVQNLLSVLSLLGLVGLRSPLKGAIVDPSAEIVTSAAFMHVSVQAFTLELVAYPTKFIFEACIEASRHSQNLHFRVGSGRVMSAMPVSSSFVTESEGEESSFEGMSPHLLDETHMVSAVGSKHPLRNGDTFVSNFEGLMQQESDLQRAQLDIGLPPLEDQADVKAFWKRSVAPNKLRRVTTAGLTASACCSDHISCVIPSYSVRVVRWDHAQGATVDGDGNSWGELATHLATKNEKKQSAADETRDCDLLSCSLMDERAGADVSCNGNCCQFIVSSASASLDYQFLAPPLMFLTECVLAHQSTSPKQHSLTASEVTKSLHTTGVERAAERGSPTLHPFSRGSDISDQTLSLFLMPLALKLTQACLDDPVELQCLLNHKRESSPSPWTAFWSLDAEPVEWNPNVDARGAPGILHPMSPPYHDINVRVSPTRLRLRLWQIERLCNALNMMQISSSMPHLIFLEKLKANRTAQGERTAPSTGRLTFTAAAQQQTLDRSRLSDGRLMDRDAQAHETSASADEDFGGWRDFSADELNMPLPPFRNVMPLSELRRILGLTEQESPPNWRQAGEVRGIPQSSMFAALCQPWVWSISRMPLLHLRLSFPVFELILINEPFADQMTAVHAETSFAKVPQHGCKTNRSRPLKDLETFFLPSSAPLIRFLVEDMRFAGANIMALSEAGSEGGMLLAESLRDNQDHGRGDFEIACASWHVQLLLLVIQQAAVEWRAGGIDSMKGLRAFWEHAMSQWLLPAVRLLDPNSAVRVTDTGQVSRLMITPVSEGGSEVCSLPPTSDDSRWPINFTRPLTMRAKAFSSYMRSKRSRRGRGTRFTKHVGSNLRGTRVGRWLHRHINSSLQQDAKGGSSCSTHSCLCLLESLPSFPACLKGFSRPFGEPLRATRPRDFQVFLMNASGMYLLLRRQASPSLPDPLWKLLRPNQTVGLKGCQNPGAQTWTTAEAACVEVLGVHPECISMFRQEQTAKASSLSENLLAKIREAELNGAASFLRSDGLPDASLIELAVLFSGTSNVEESAEARIWRCQTFVVSVRAAVTADGLPYGNELITISSPLIVRNLSPLDLTCLIGCEQVQLDFGSHKALPEVKEKAIDKRRDEDSSALVSRCCGFQKPHTEARSCKSPFVRLGEKMWFSGLTDVSSNRVGCGSTESDVARYSFSCLAYNTVHGVPAHVMFNALKKRVGERHSGAAVSQVTDALAEGPSRRILEGSSWSFGLQANRLQCFTLLGSTMPSLRCLSCASSCRSKAALCDNCSKLLMEHSTRKQRQCSSSTITHVFGRKGTHCAVLAFQPGYPEGSQKDEIPKSPTSLFLIACLNTTSWTFAKKGLDTNMEMEVLERQATEVLTAPSGTQAIGQETNANDEIAMQTWTLKAPLRICNHLPLPISLRLVDLPLWEDMGNTGVFEDERTISSGPPSKDVGYHQESSLADDQTRRRKQASAQCVPTGGWGLLSVPSESERSCCSVHGCDGLVGALEMGSGPWSAWHILWTGIRNRELKTTSTTSEVQSKAGTAKGRTKHCLADDLKYVQQDPPYRRNILSEETIIKVRDFCDRISEVRICCILSPVDPALPPFVRASAAAVTIIITSPVTILQRCVDTPLCILPGSAKTPLDYFHQKRTLFPKDWCCNDDHLVSSDGMHSDSSKSDLDDSFGGGMWSHGQLSGERQASHTPRLQHHLEVVEASTALFRACQESKRMWPNLQTVSQLPQFFVSNRVVLGSQELTNLRLAEVLSDAFSLHHEQSKQLVAASTGTNGGQAENDIATERSSEVANAEDIPPGCETSESKRSPLSCALPCLGGNCTPLSGQGLCGSTSCASSWTHQYDFARREFRSRPDNPIVAEWSLDLDLERLLCPALWHLLPRCLSKVAGKYGDTHQFLPKELQIKGLKSSVNLKIGSKDFVLHQTEMKRPDSHFLLLTILPFLPGHRASRHLDSLPAGETQRKASQGKVNPSNMRELHILPPDPCPSEPPSEEPTFFTFSELFESFDGPASDSHAKASAEHLCYPPRIRATAVSQVLSTTPPADEWDQLCSFLSAPSVTLQVLPRFVFLNTTKLDLEIRQVFPSSRCKPAVVSAYNLAFGGVTNGEFTHRRRQPDSWSVTGCTVGDAKLREDHLMDGATPIFRLPHNCAIVFHFADVEAAYAVNIRIASTPIRPTLNKRAVDNFDPLELPHPSFEGLRLYDVLLRHGVFRQNSIGGKAFNPRKPADENSAKFVGDSRKPFRVSPQVSKDHQSSTSSSDSRPGSGLDSGRSAMKASGSHEVGEKTVVSNPQDYGYRQNHEANKDSGLSEDWLPRSKKEGPKEYPHLRGLPTKKKAERKGRTGMALSGDSAVEVTQNGKHYESSTSLNGEPDQNALKAHEAYHSPYGRHNIGLSGESHTISTGEFLSEAEAGEPTRKRRSIPLTRFRRRARRGTLEMFPRMRRVADLHDASNRQAETGRASVLAEFLRTQPAMLSDDAGGESFQSTSRLSAFRGGRPNLVDMIRSPSRQQESTEGHGMWREPRQANKSYNMGGHVETRTKGSSKPSIMSEDFPPVSEAELPNGLPTKSFEDVQLPYFSWTDALCIGAPPSASEAVIDRRATQRSRSRGAELSPRAGTSSTASENSMLREFEDAGEAAASRSASQSIPLYDCIGNLFAAILCTTTTGKAAHDSGVSYIHLSPAQVAPIQIENHLTETPILVTASAPCCFSTVDSAIAASTATELIPTLVDGSIAPPPSATSSSGPPADVVPPLQARPMWLRRPLPLCLACEVGDQAATVAQSAQDSAIAHDLHRIRREDFRMLKRLRLREPQRIDAREVKQSTRSPSLSPGKGSDSSDSGASPRVSPRLKASTASRSSPGGTPRSNLSGSEARLPPFRDSTVRESDERSVSDFLWPPSGLRKILGLVQGVATDRLCALWHVARAAAEAARLRWPLTSEAQGRRQGSWGLEGVRFWYDCMEDAVLSGASPPHSFACPRRLASYKSKAKNRALQQSGPAAMAASAAATLEHGYVDVDALKEKLYFRLVGEDLAWIEFNLNQKKCLRVELQHPRRWYYLSARTRGSTFIVSITGMPPRRVRMAEAASKPSSSFWETGMISTNDRQAEELHKESRQQDQCSDDDGNVQNQEDEGIAQRQLKTRRRAPSGIARNDIFDKILKVSLRLPTFCFTYIGDQRPPEVSRWLGFPKSARCIDGLSCHQLVFDARMLEASFLGLISAVDGTLDDGGFFSSMRFQLESSLQEAHLFDFSSGAFCPLVLGPGVPDLNTNTARPPRLEVTRPGTCKSVTTMSGGLHEASSSSRRAKPMVKVILVGSVQAMRGYPGMLPFMKYFHQEVEHASIALSPMVLNLHLGSLLDCATSVHAACQLPPDSVVVALSTPTHYVITHKSSPQAPSGRSHRSGLCYSKDSKGPWMPRFPLQLSTCSEAADCRCSTCGNTCHISDGKSSENTQGCVTEANLALFHHEPPTHKPLRGDFHTMEHQNVRSFCVSEVFCSAVNVQVSLRCEDIWTHFANRSLGVAHCPQKGNQIDGTYRATSQPSGNGDRRVAGRHHGARCSWLNSATLPALLRACNVSRCAIHMGSFQSQVVQLPLPMLAFFLRRHFQHEAVRCAASLLCATEALCNLGAWRQRIQMITKLLEEVFSNVREQCGHPFCQSSDSSSSIGEGMPVVSVSLATRMVAATFIAGIADGLSTFLGLGSSLSSAALASLRLTLTDAFVENFSSQRDMIVPHAMDTPPSTLADGLRRGVDRLAVQMRQLAQEEGLMFAFASLLLNPATSLMELGSLAARGWEQELNGLAVPQQLPFYNHRQTLLEQLLTQLRSERSASSVAITSGSGPAAVEFTPHQGTSAAAAAATVLAVVSRGSRVPLPRLLCGELRILRQFNSEDSLVQLVLMRLEEFQHLPYLAHMLDRHPRSTAADLAAALAGERRHVANSVEAAGSKDTIRSSTGLGVVLLVLLGSKCILLVGWPLGPVLVFDSCLIGCIEITANTKHPGSCSALVAIELSRALEQQVYLRSAVAVAGVSKDSAERRLNPGGWSRSVWAFADSMTKRERQHCPTKSEDDLVTETHGFFNIVDLRPDNPTVEDWNVSTGNHFAEHDCTPHEPHHWSEPLNPDEQERVHQRYLHSRSSTEELWEGLKGRAAKWLLLQLNMVDTARVVEFRKALSKKESMSR